GLVEADLCNGPSSCVLVRNAFYAPSCESAVGSVTALAVAEASYKVTDPTVDSQVVALNASGADTLLDVALPKFAAQAIRKVAEVDWHPLHIVPYPASSIPLVMQPAALDHSVGVVTAEFLKEPGDPVWPDDP